MEEKIDVKNLQELTDEKILELADRVNSNRPITPTEVCQILKYGDAGSYDSSGKKVITAMKYIIENRSDKIQVISDIFNRFCSIYTFKTEVCNIVHYYIRLYRMPLRIRKGLIKLYNCTDRNKHIPTKKILNDLQK